LGKHEHGIKVNIGGPEMPEKIKLVSGEVVLDEKVFAEDVELVEEYLGEKLGQVDSDDLIHRNITSNALLLLRKKKNIESAR
jgi:hypothetical protein